MTPPSTIPPDVQAWLDTLPAEERTALLEVWSLTGSLPAAPAPAPELRAATWAHLEALSAPAPGIRPTFGLAPPLRLATSLRRYFVPLSLATAAVVALLVVTTWWIRLQPTTLQAPAGQTLAVDLPDGSHVELNSGSTLTYDNAFGTASRALHLTGEAFFTVKPDARLPFVVESFDALVEVLGTRFNVRAWPGDVRAGTRVAVVSGRVRFANRFGQHSGVTLLNGQGSALVDGVPSPPDSLELASALAWREGGLAFQNQPLGVLFDELERRFGIDIQADEALRVRPYSYFKQRILDAEAVLEDLSQMTGLRYRKTDDGYAVFLP